MTLSAPRPKDEEARLAALRRYDILDTPPEENFDSITRLAAQIANVPIAAITLLDADRQWFKSRVGLDAPETPRDIGFCAHTVLQRELFIVNDALDDQRFATNPLVVAEPHLRFYAGAPLVTGEDYALGALCVADRVPRILDPGQTTALSILARQVVTELELRRLVAELQDTVGKFQQSETARHHLVSLVENSSDFIGMTDLTGRMFFLNEAGKRLVGLAEDTATRSTRLSDYVPLKSRTFVDQTVLPAVLEQVTWAGEVDMLHFQTHVHIPAAWNLFRIDDPDTGEASKIAVISRDMTERNRVEARVRRNQAQVAHMARLNVAGEMASGLAHELNQPLTAISSYADGCLLMLDSETADTKSLRNTVKNIALQSRRAGDIIRHLRDFTRKGKPNWAPVEINPLIREVVLLSEFGARQRDIAMQLELESPLPMVIADNIQIQQVVLNLIRNGFEAMESGERRLMIRTARKGSEEVEVAVCDRGIGLDAEAAGKLFHPFFTTKRDGMGLGLALSKSIIEAHRGRLWATTNPDRGTTFHFTLPVAQQTPSDIHGIA